MNEYPEHEKFQAVRDKSQAIGEFIEWLKDTQKITLAKWYRAKWEDDRIETDRLMPEYFDINKLLAEYFGIDVQKLEEEKRAMLETLRKREQS